MNRSAKISIKSLLSSQKLYGKSYNSPHLSLKTAVLSLQENSVFSFIISKKTVRNAAARNLLKRRCRSIISSIRPNIKNRNFGVFFLKKGSDTLSFMQLKNEMELLLKKTGLLVKQ